MEILKVLPEQKVASTSGETIKYGSVHAGAQLKKKRHSSSKKTAKKNKKAMKRTGSKKSEKKRNKKTKKETKTKNETKKRKGFFSLFK